MSIDYPKILSAFTLDAALTLTLYVDNAGSYNLDVTVTIPAGTYFMAWDNQSDDFLNVVMDACYTALVAAGGVGGYDGADADGKPILGINTDHKVTIDIGGDLDVRFAWTENDGATVAGILGFDATANLDIEGTQAVADYPHAYGWYASEPGQLSNLMVEDSVEEMAAQSFAVAGDAATQHLAERYYNQIELRWLTRDDTFSRGVAYATASVDHYTRNRALECWWREARQGTRFRVYRDSIVDTTKAEEPGTATGGAATTIIAAGKSWTTTPQEHAGKLVIIPSWYGSASMRWYITSHDATTITVPNGLHNNVAGTNADTFYVFDQRYQTYVLDLFKSRNFNPTQIPSLDEYEASFALRRYVST